MSTPLTCLDLFCGCGGFTLGMEYAGFRTLAAIDLNPEAIKVHRHNFPNVLKALQKDLTRFKAEQLDEMIKGERVDVIVGGPPCQGFSKVRRVDGANNGTRFVEDNRRYLYQQFLAYVAYFQPRVFVMENVLGIKSAVGGDFLTRVQAEARTLGYRVQSFPVWFELPIPRMRQFRVIGNALPPLVDEAIGLAVKSFLAECAFSSRGHEAHSERRNGSQSFLTSADTRVETARELDRLVRLDCRHIRSSWRVALELVKNPSIN